MATGVVSWSTTAATNATADANVNWAEGQAPSSVNDSARAMMASVAKWRDDNNGSVTTGGGTTAYTVTSNQGFATLAAMHRQSFRLLWNLTCATTPTLNVDGLGAKSIVSSVGTNIGAGALIANCVYDLVYDNNNAVFIVTGSPLAFPTGTTMVFAQSAAPTGWTQNVGINDFALRVTSGAGGGVGGSTGFTTVFAARTLTQGNLPSGVTLSQTGTGTAGTAAASGTGSPNTASQTLNHTQSANSPLAPNSGQTAATFSNGTGAGLTYYSPNQFAAIDSHTVTFPSTTVSVTVPNLSVTGVSVSLGGSSTALDFAVAYVNVIVCAKS
jgi:hypothetical protein